MGDPTDTELAGLNTIDETAAFTQLDGAENDVRTSRGSFLQLLGFNAGARMAALGMISEADVDAALAAWKIATVLDADGRVTSRRDPTMAELGKAKIDCKNLQAEDRFRCLNNWCLYHSSSFICGSS